MTIALTSAGRALLVEESDGRLVVRTARGDVLDREAAEVLVSLGGRAPDWLPTLDGLEAVHAHYGLDAGALARAADALGAGKARQAELARTSEDPVVQLALAAAGVAQVAANPALTPDAWQAVWHHPDEGVCLRARGYAAVLPVALAGVPDPDVRRRVAANPACPPEVLDRLGRDPLAGTASHDRAAAVAVRVAVAAHPATPARTLAHLARVGDDAVQAAVGRNRRAPARALVRAALSGPHARAAVVGNPSWPAWAAGLSATDASTAVREALAERHDLPGWAVSLLERYARRDGLFYLRLRALLRDHFALSPRVAGRFERIGAEVQAWADPRPRVQAPRARRALLVLWTVVAWVGAISCVVAAIAGFVGLAALGWGSHVLLVPGAAAGAVVLRLASRQAGWWLRGAPPFRVRPPRLREALAAVPATLVGMVAGLMVPALGVVAGVALWRRLVGRGGAE